MTEFERRRREFSRQIGDAIAVFSSARPAVRSNDGEYEYRQDTDFYYLTGCEEPDSVLVLAPQHPQTKSIMFVRGLDREREAWEGRRIGPDKAPAAFGVDAAYPIDELKQRLPELLAGADVLYYGFGSNEAFDATILDQLKHFRFARRRMDHGPVAVFNPAPLLHEMRMRKSPADIAGMRRAVAISAQAHIAAMRRSRPGMHEYEVQAIVEYVFTSRGAQSRAYSSIVASGANATFLHYHQNRDRIDDGSLVLVDAGAEVDYYCGDLTRTWPISGTFSPEQKAVYEIVLAAQQRAIELCRPGETYNTKVHDASVEVITRGLIDLGVLKGSVAENVERETFKEYYMHRIGHFLGMDTHDVGYYKKNGAWRALEPGMVVTIEPGLYFREDSGCPQRFRGIGVRIEDNILITESGHENLSADVPKTVAEVEDAMTRGRASAEAALA